MRRRIIRGRVRAAFASAIFCRVSRLSFSPLFQGVFP
jgi:hypothetical protein